MEGQTIVKKEEFNEINWPRVSIFNVKVVDPWAKGLKRNFSGFSLKFHKPWTIEQNL